MSADVQPYLISLGVEYFAERRGSLTPDSDQGQDQESDVVWQ